MPEWMNVATGEIVEGGPCPECAATADEAAIQVGGMERELRSMRSKLTKAERAAERDEVKRRDGDIWQRILGAWLETFPDKRPTAKGIRSARATAVFLRLESGAAEEDVVAAIVGARVWPYVVYGKRRQSGSPSDEATDLQEIMSLKNDGMFDFLRDVGAVEREKAPTW